MPKTSEFMKKRVLNIKDKLLVEAYIYKKKDIFMQYVHKYGIDQIIDIFFEKHLIQDAQDVLRYICSDLDQKDMFGMNKKELEELEELRNNSNEN